MLKRVQPGDRLEISANAYNAFVDAAQANIDRQLSTNFKAATGGTATSVVQVRNNSGAACVRFGVLAIGTPVISPDVDLVKFQNGEIVFEGYAPSDADAGFFGILLEPLADGKIGKVVISGLCHCQIDVQAESHDYAEVVDGESGYLQSNVVGSATILWKESGTGTKWAMVKLGGGSNGNGNEWADIPVVNNSAETIPACSFVELSGWSEPDLAFEIIKPTSSHLDLHEYAIVGQEIAVGQIGRAYSDGYATVSLSSVAHCPIGQIIGPVKNYYYGHGHQQGWRVVKYVSTAYPYTAVVQYVGAAFPRLFVIHDTEAEDGKYQIKERFWSIENDRFEDIWSDDPATTYGQTIETSGHSLSVGDYVYTIAPRSATGVYRIALLDYAMWH